MTTRSELQAKSIKDLRSIGQAVGIKTDGIQKAKLIDAIMGTGAYDGSDGTVTLDLPEVVTKDGGQKAAPPSDGAPAKAGSTNGERSPDSGAGQAGTPTRDKATRGAHQRGQEQSGTHRQRPDSPGRSAQAPPAPRRTERSRGTTGGS